MGTVLLLGAGKATPVVAASSLLTNLNAYWKLDETSGTRADSTASGLTLTDNNTVTSNTGKQSNGAQFTRANSESLSRSNPSAVQMGDIDFTLAGWAKFDSLGQNFGIIGRWTSAPNREYLIWYDNSTSRLIWDVSIDGTNGNTVSANNLGAPTTATWYFIVAWHDSVANTINIQVNDGTVDSVSYSSGVLAGASNLQLGHNEDGGATWYLDGMMDEWGIWKNQVLSSTQRTNLYNSGSGTTYPFTGIP